MIHRQPVDAVRAVKIKDKEEVFILSFKTR